MITQIPIRIAQAARAVTLAHPNAMDCQVYRKKVLRTNASGEEMGGAPTLGGLGVLSPEDESDFEYEAIGAGKILFTEWTEELDIVDRDDGLAPGVNLIACRIEALDGTQFTPEKNDLIAVMPGAGVLLGYEVVGLSSKVNIPPYTRKYAVQPRDELHDLVPWSKR